VPKQLLLSIEDDENAQAKNEINRRDATVFCTLEKSRFGLICQRPD
jgi:hypothetical protein